VGRCGFCSLSRLYARQYMSDCISSVRSAVETVKR
jgi:hypothetical protein